MNNCGQAIVFLWIKLWKKCGIVNKQKENTKKYFIKIHLNMYKYNKNTVIHIVYTHCEKRVVEG